MSFGLLTFGLAFFAGMLSTLSPCVLPLIPVLVASANDTHRGGIWALGAGLAITFTVLGLFLATIGAAAGLDAETFRAVGAVMLALFGTLLVSPQLQGRFGLATAGVGQFGHSLLAKVKPDGLHGQFAVGSLLGLVWSPCVGPTLGAATTLASQGRSLAPSGIMMLSLRTRRGYPAGRLRLAVARDADACARPPYPYWPTWQTATGGFHVAGQRINCDQTR